MYKKIIFLFAIVITVGMSAFAQNEDAAAAPKFAIGIGPELNMNTPEGFAGGAGLSFDYSLAKALAAGINVSASYNFAETFVLEFGALFRFYLLGIGHTGFFAQIDAGSTLIMEEAEMMPVFMGGLRTGHRIGIGAGYFEPYFRIGYPFAFGVGVIGGIRFDITPNSNERPARNSRTESSDANEE